MSGPRSHTPRPAWGAHQRVREPCGGLHGGPTKTHHHADAVPMTLLENASLGRAVAPPPLSSEDPSGCLKAQSEPSPTHCVFLYTRLRWGLPYKLGKEEIRNHNQ